MKCPNCGVASAPEWGDWPLQLGRRGTAEQLSEKPGERWFVRFFQCTECKKIAIFLSKGAGTLHGGMEEHLLWPHHAVEEPLSPHVPTEIADEYEEARRALSVSRKASAALSRRLLQLILREKAGAAQRDLAAQIEAVLPSLPGYLQTTVDQVRIVGAFAAHPLKGEQPGTIAEVEQGEAEWSLETLHDVIDFYYVRPALLADRKDRLNQKQAAAGKPPMK